MKSAPSAAPPAIPYERKLASVAAVITDATRMRRLGYLLAGHIYAARTSAGGTTTKDKPTTRWPTRKRLHCARCCYGQLASFKHLAGLLPSVNAL